MKKLRNSYFGRGGRFAAVTVAVIVAVIALNALLGGILPGADVSEKKIFTLSDATKASLSKSGSDVTMFIVGDETTANMTFVNIAKAFEKACSGIGVKYLTVEGAAYYTASEVTDSDIIVTDGALSVLIEAEDAYGYVYSTDENGQTAVTDIEITLEQQLLTAVEEIRGKHSVCYLLQGHGETEPGDIFKQDLLGFGYRTQYLYLNESKAIPDDCSMVIINAPTTDITDIEAELLSAFLDNNGIVMLMTDGQCGVGDNLSSVTEHAGLKTIPGLLLERDAGHLLDASYPYYLLCDYADNSFGYSDTIPALMAIVHGIEMIGADGYTAFPILTTSESAYNKPSAYTDGVFTYAEGDDTGIFVTAAGSCPDDGEGGLIWFASAQCMADGIDEMIYGSNYKLATSYLEALGAEKTQFTAVEGKSATEQVIPAGTVMPIIFLAVPAVILIVGIVLVSKRSSVKQNKE